MDTQQALPANVLQATRTLTENLQHAEPVVLYQQAQERLDSDSETSLLLQRLAQTQAAFRKHQGEGGVTQKDIDSLRALQGQARSNPLVTAHAEAQQVAIEHLQVINQEISQLLGLDFCSLAKKAGCC